MRTPPTGLRRRLRYHFDNLMARGAAAQVVMLAVLSGLLVVATATGVWLLGLTPSDEDLTYGQIVWRSLMRTLDAGNLDGDAGHPAFVFFMMLATLGGIFVVSAFIGVLNASLGEVLEGLRKGRSVVVEQGHTVILGYTPKVHTLLHELALANANQRRACVVILAQRDKVEMDDEIREHLGPERLQVVTRSGSPMSLSDLEIVNLPAAKAVIVMSPERDEEGAPIAPHEADTVVLKTLLAITKNPSLPEHRYHVVAELQDERILQVARLVIGDRAALLLAPPLVSKLLVQTGRQSGLSAVFTELLDFAGNEMYVQEEPRLVGKTFREVLVAYDDSAVLGVLTATDELLLPPPFDRPVAPGDRVLAISQDDDTVVPNGRPGPIDERVLVAPRPAEPPRPARTLVLGTSERLGFVLRELAPYCASGSSTLVVGEDGTTGAAVAAEADAAHPNLGVVFRPGDVTDRRLLDEIDVTSFDHVLVLSEAKGRSVDLADARTMLTLLHLRDIARRAGRSVPVTTEMLDVQNRELAAVAEADDFIVSNTLIALMIAQLAENAHLVRVFDDLFTFGGHDIRIKPASQYVVPGEEVDFYAIVEAAARRDEIAFGYRLAARARDPRASYGVVVNPRKGERLRLGEKDQVVVLSPVTAAADVAAAPRAASG